MKIAKIAVVAVLGAVFSGSVLAQSVAEKREARQQQRIGQGVASGQLNKREAARLQRGETHIDKMEAHAAADGKVTAKEKARINHAQNVESRRIHRQKHDAQVQK